MTKKALSNSFDSLINKYYHEKQEKATLNGKIVFVLQKQGASGC